MSKHNQRNAKNLHIESLKHKDKRKNIPTEELRDFVKEDEQKPAEIKFPGLLYARDPSLDPQLVWKDKDEQDKQPLTVPAVPIYIQEKIHPQAVIEDLRRSGGTRSVASEQLALFADFNGIKFEEMIEFYRHESNWSNRMILGDSLLVMTSLAEKERLKGQVQMIYIDPPYGIKFNSNWQVSTRKRDVKDGKAEDLTRQPEQVRAFRDTWKLGIHSYLAYLRDRLVVARELLTESGSVFVQIGDENVHLVRCIMDEVFGTENFVTQIVVKKTGSQSGDFVQGVNDFICWYSKDKTLAKQKFRQLFIDREERDKDDFSPDPLTSAGETEGSTFTFEFERRSFNPGDGAHWKTNRPGMERLRITDRILAQKNQIRFKKYWEDFPVKQFTNIWNDLGGASDMVYVVQTNVKMVERCLLMTTDPGDLVLDPTCGSGTTAYVAEQWGRRWITCDTSRVALALARTRLMSARFPYYLLADSSEGMQKEAEITGKLPPQYKTDNDIRKGFICRRVPHITLKSIANNEEIDVIHARYQPQLDELRKKINRACGKKWEEWEIPRPEDRGQRSEVSGQRSEVSREVMKMIEEWRELWKKRQAEIDACIQKNAEQEILVDQPYADNKRIRVTGPFTVESLSPHRTISFEQKRALKEKGVEGFRVDIRGAGEFGNIIIENLKKAGVQNTIRNERLKFDRLEPFAGTWIHAEGEFTEVSGQKSEISKRVAVCIGPEHGTVGPELIKEAAKEAVKGRGFDLLLICGFAFDPHVSEEIKRYGDLTVLPVRMNSDLSMGEELLKKTGAGNLFMVFGEPDIEIVDFRLPISDLKGKTERKIQVTIKGMDIYDPTTGEIRNNSIDDIACWFIDTNYNEESFFVRHAYFTGGDEPYDKLKRALRAEINEEAWSALYSTASRPFDPPKTGKIAIKVINHYGDEVIKVYEINDDKREKKD